MRILENRKILVGRFFSFVRAPFLLVIIPLFTIICSIITIGIIVPLFSRKTCDWFILFWARGLCWLSGIRVLARGQEKLKDINSAILVSNHLGLFDIPVLYAALPGFSFRMAAKAELFKIPLFGAAIRAAGFFPVMRSGGESSVVSLQKIVKRFKNGESFWMAPEGTRFTGVGVGEFKLGAFFLAVKANQPVVPICIYGTQNVLPKHTALVNWGVLIQDVHVHVLSPVPAYTSAQTSPGSSPWVADEATARQSLRELVRNQIVSEFFQIHNASAVHRLTR